MSTRTSAGVQGTTLVSLLFIYMIPIDCKITKFSLYLFPFKKFTIIIFGACLAIDQWKTRQPVHFVFAHFQPILCSIINRTARKVSLQSILQSSHNRTYTECSIIKAHTSLINFYKFFFFDFKVGVSLGHGFFFASGCSNMRSKQRTFEVPCTYPTLALKP